MLKRQRKGEVKLIARPTKRDKREQWAVVKQGTDKNQVGIRKSSGNILMIILKTGVRKVELASLKSLDHTRDKAHLHKY